MRAIGADPPGTSRSGPVLVANLALRELLEGDREVVARRRIHHRRRELLIAALAERAVIAVQLTSALGRDEHGGKVGIGAIEKLVNAWLDHVFRRGPLAPKEAGALTGGA